MLEVWRNHVEDARANENLFSNEAIKQSRNPGTCLRGVAGAVLEELGLGIQRRMMKKLGTELIVDLTRYSLAFATLDRYIDVEQVEKQFMIGVREGRPRKVEDAIDAMEDAIMQAKRGRREESNA